MRKIKQLILLVLLIIPLKIVEANTIDFNKIGSLKVNYVYGDKVIDNATVSLYHIANIDSNGHYQYVLNYESLSFDLNVSSSSELNALALNLEKFIQAQNIVAEKSAKTSEGQVLFDNLQIGLYLVVTDKIEVDDYEYNAAPMLVVIPNYNTIDDEYNYDVNMHLKTEAIKVKVEEEPKEEIKEPTPEPSVPQTLDDIYIYVGVLAVSIVFICIIIAILNKSKRSEKENEINNEKNK